MKRLFLLCFLTSIKALFVLIEPALAQNKIVPDTTLNEDSSVVVSLDSFGLSIDEIRGGLSRGPNLFHSFLEFNIGDERSAYFINNSNQIENILSRVTGDSPSTILGTLGIASSPGIESKPNLLFINPNGILFGLDASLDLPASFVASTADAIQLGNSGLFSAGYPENDQLLSVNPSALFFNEAPFGLIRNQAVDGSTANGIFANPLPSIPQSTQISEDNPVISLRRGLQVPDGQRLAIVGGNVALEGGLSSVGGFIDVGSVSSSGRVNLNFSPDGFTTHYSEIEKLGDIRLSSAAVNSSGPMGGSIQLQAARIFTDRNNNFSGILAETQGELGSREVFIKATEELALENAGISTVVQFGVDSNGGSIQVESPVISIKGLLSSLVTRNFGMGMGGDIEIEVDRLTLRNGSEIITGVSGAGSAGSIRINATEFVDAQGFISSEGLNSGGIEIDSQGTGFGGTIDIITRELMLGDGALITARTIDGAGGAVNIKASESIYIYNDANIQTQTFGQGDAGDIQIRTQRILSEGRSGIDATARFGSEGDAGDIEIVANESIEIDGIGGIINAVIFGSGNSGKLTIRTPYLSLRNGGTVSAAAFTSGNPSGSVEIFSELIEVDGGDLDGFTASRITTRGSSSSDQPLGDIYIQTGRLVIQNGGSISVDSIADNAPAGNLSIEASDSVDVTGQSEESSSSSLSEPTSSRISGRTRDSVGGNITITTPELSISDKAIVSTTSSGSGRAGDVNVVGETLILDTLGKLEATSFSGNGGNLNLQLSDLLVLRREAEISTSAGTERVDGNGGNIDIVSPFLVAIGTENSDISANAFSGEGGAINIQATGIFGTEVRSVQTRFSDITASSDIGVDGTVEINALSTEFIEEGLTELPSTLVSSETLISSSCIARGQNSGGATLLLNDSNYSSLSFTASSSNIYPTGSVQNISVDATESENSNLIIEPQAVYRATDGRLIMSRDCDH